MSSRGYLLGSSSQCIYLLNLFSQFIYFSFSLHHRFLFIISSISSIFHPFILLNNNNNNNNVYDFLFSLKNYLILKFNVPNEIINQVYKLMSRGTNESL